MRNRPHASTCRIWSTLSDTIPQTQWLDTCEKRGLGLAHQQAVQLGLLRLEQAVFGEVLLWHTGWMDGVTQDDLTVRSVAIHLDLPTSILPSALSIASPQADPKAAYDHLFSEYHRSGGAGFYFASLRSDGKQAEIDRALRSREFSPDYLSKVLRECGGTGFSERLSDRVARLTDAHRMEAIGWLEIAKHPSRTASLHERRSELRMLCESCVLGDTPECLKKLATVIGSSAARDAAASTNRSHIYHARLALEREFSRDPGVRAMASRLISRFDHLQREIRVERARAVSWPDWVYEASSPHAAEIEDDHAADRPTMQLVATALQGLSPRSFSSMRTALNGTRGALLAGRMSPVEFVAPIVEEVSKQLLSDEPTHVLDLLTDAFRKFVLKDLAETLGQLPEAALRGAGVDLGSDSPRRIMTAVFGDAACAALEKHRSHARRKLKRRLTPTVAAAIAGALASASADSSTIATLTRAGHPS